MDTINFLTNSSPASGVGAVPYGDTVNQPLRNLLTALGASPGAGATYDWRPGLYDKVLNLQRDYGIIADGSDEYTKLQAAFDDASDPSNYTHKTLYAGPGLYGYAKPPRIWGNGITLIGAGRSSFNVDLGLATRFQPISSGYWAGPGIYLGSVNMPIPLAGSLVGGAGNALNLQGSPGYFNLRDSDTFDLNGLPAFALELFHVRLSTPGNYYYVTMSGGTLFASAASTAFGLLVDANSKVNIWITTTTGLHQVVASAALDLGTTYGIYLDYDGATLRLFQGPLGASSVLVGSIACTGTIVQGPFEEVLISGAYLAGGAESYFSTTNNGIYGLLSSIRYSRVSRHTAVDTVPTQRLESDGNTCGMLNFDNQMYDLTEMKSYRGSSWLAYRQYQSPHSPCGQNFRMAHLDILAPGSQSCFQLARGAGQGGIYEDMRFSGRYGLWGPTNQDGFWWGMRNVYMKSPANGRYGIAACSNSGGICALDTVQVVSFPCDLVHGSTLSAINLYLSTGPQSVLGAALFSADTQTTWSVNGLSIDTEGGLAAGYIAGLGLANASGAFSGVNIGNAGTKPSVIISGCGQVEMLAPIFHMLGAEACAVKVLSAPVTPIVLRSPRPIGDVPWSDTPGAVTVDLPGRRDKAFSATPTFDFSIVSKWTFAQLTADVTAQTWQRAGDGQPIVVRYQQHASSAKTVAAPSNVIGWTAISATLSSISEFRGSYDQGLGKFVGSMFAGLT